MSLGTHIKLLLNRLCIRTQTEEKEHSQTPTAPTAAPPSPFLPSLFHPAYAPCSEEEWKRRADNGDVDESTLGVLSPIVFRWSGTVYVCLVQALPPSCHLCYLKQPQIFASLQHTALYSCAESTRTAQERLSVRQRSAGPFFLKRHRIPTLWMSRLLGGTRVALLGSSLSLPITAAQMCVLSCMAVNYLIN